MNAESGRSRVGRMVIGEESERSRKINALGNAEQKPGAKSWLESVTNPVRAVTMLQAARLTAMRRLRETRSAMTPATGDVTACSRETAIQ